MYYFVNMEKYCQIWTYSVWFHFTLLLFAHFWNEIEKFIYKSHWNILVFWNQWKMMADLNISHDKISDFDSFPLFQFTLVIKLGNYDFESHWNLYIFWQIKIWYQIWIFPMEKYLIFLISIVWVHFSHKTEKFGFWSSTKTFKYLFIQKWCHSWLCLVK